MGSEFDSIREALERMPVPDPRPGFVDRALARAAASPDRAHEPRRSRRRWREILRRRETWWGAAAGAFAAGAAVIAVIAIYPRSMPDVQAPLVGLVLDETREISVVIDAERNLPDATIRVYVSGGIELAGYEDQHELLWTATLEPGSNLLALPVVARAPGAGQLVAEIEHEGRRKRVVMDVRVSKVANNQRSDVVRPLQDGTA